MIIAVYAITLLISSSLLFIVQPMVAKLVLPHLGGTSAVWTTCMLFFQAALLGGYAYAHFIAKRLTVKRQVMLHLVLMAVALISIPFEVRQPGFEPSSYPISWLLYVLTACVGLPFLVVSASAPLLQHWFSTSDHPDRDDPYHLYSASNMGSMAALLGYPFVIEPLIGVQSQSTLWAVGYVALIAAFLACARFVGRRGRGELASAPTSISDEPITWPRRAKWILWAFLPSSLMLGLTQYITTDLASLPLLWIAPLALYLLSFIVAFAKRTLAFNTPVRILIPVLLLAALAAPSLDISMVAIVCFNLAVFFVVAWFFHAELAADRPAAKDLTQFFLIMSFGGVLGGMFNALLAPLIFSRAVDYIFVVAIAIMAMRAPPENDAYPGLLGVFYAGLGFAYLGLIGFFRLRLDLYLVYAALLIPVIVVGAWKRPKLTNVLLGMVLLVGLEADYRTWGLVEAKRSFFGAYKVYDRDNRGHPYRSFSHGTTSHGTQSREPQYRHEPLSYHHPVGPVGQTLKAIPHKDVLVVGLGAGAMSAYAYHDDIRVKLFEIDPVVEELARRHFTYLEDCGDKCEVAIGDGRQLMKDEPDKKYEIIMLDAYNSDSVPTHLLSREAIQLYLQKLAPEGVLLFNVSNRHLSIESVVGAIAKDLGLASRAQTHFPSDELMARKVEITAYVVVARETAHLRGIATNPAWRETKVLPSVWTDDYSSLLGAFR